MCRENWKNLASWRGLAAALAVLLVLVASAPGLAQTGPETMNFQGRLLDADGDPVTEPRCMRFRLCSDVDCFESPWPFPAAEFEHHLVIPENGTYKAGLFTVALGSVYAIAPDLLYNYDTLFLEIGVAPEADPCSDLPSEEWQTMQPRSQLRANAYAQRSRRVRTVESDNVPLVEVVNTGSGGAVYGQTSSGVGVRGIGGGASGQVPSAQVGVWGDTSDGIGVLGYSSSTSANMAGVAGWATATSGQAYGVWGSTSSDSGYGVYGKGTQVGIRGIGGIESGTPAGGAVGVWGDSRDGAGVHGSSINGYGVHGMSNSATSDAAAGFFEATNTSGRTYGIHATNDSTTDSAAAGYFHATGNGGETRGVYGQSDSPWGDGVRGEGVYHGLYGEGLDPSGLTYGVYGKSDGSNGYGVWGQSLHQDGVHGVSTNHNGVFGTTASSDSGAAGVYGVATATDGETYGVYGQALSADGYGVYSLGDAHVAGELSWTAKTSYISIGPFAFDHYAPQSYTPEILVQEIRPPADCAAGTMYGYMAHLQLPHGATLKSLSFYWQDDAPMYDSELRLLRIDFMGGSPLYLAEMYTSGSADTPTSTTHTWVTGDPVAAVDNSTNAYLLDLSLYCGTKFYAALIEYTISEPY